MSHNGALSSDGREFQVLLNPGDMTGADRTWAVRYNVGDVLQYVKGSKQQGIEPGTYAIVREVNPMRNNITVESDNGLSVTYDPKRLKGVHVYQTASREFATGDRISFTASDKRLGVANRDLGVVTAIGPGRITVRLDGKASREIGFDPSVMKHLDHGYAVTSHSSQGLTATRVLINIDTDSARALVNSRLAYVAVSRASEDARIYTNDLGALAQRLSSEVTKTAAIQFDPQRTSDAYERANDNLSAIVSHPGMAQPPIAIEEIESSFGRSI